jgi:hypothetical protein
VIIPESLYRQISEQFGRPLDDRLFRQINHHLLSQHKFLLYLTLVVSLRGALQDFEQDA